LDFIANNPLYGYLFIFCARVTDVSLDVFRLLMLTRGYAIPAALIGFVEVAIFIMALGTVMAGGVNDPWKVAAYAGGFATGNLVGLFIEEKMALGYVVIHIFPTRQCCSELLPRLRDNNYGVTSLTGEGRSGPREILVVTVKRKDLSHVLELIDEVEPETFFNISDVRSIRGGVFPRHRP